ncbi:MAG TPA: hemolysin family protein [Puia sp.]
MVFILLLTLLILINAYFSAVEIALVSIRKYKIQQLADTGNRPASQILEIIADPDQFLSSIQVGITLVGIIEGLYGGEVLASVVEPKFREWGMHAWLAHSSSLVLSIGLITYVTIVIGELLPKSLALQYPQKTALRIIGSFRIFTLIAYPFVKLLTASTHFIARRLGIKGSENQKITETDLRSLLSLAYRQGALEKTELTLHENIFTFYDMTVEKLMSNKDEVVFIKEPVERVTIENTLRSSKHSIFPVLHPDSKVAGCLYAKDYFMDKEKPIAEIILPACRVHRDYTASDLLKKFQDKSQNFAVVVNTADEMEGIVTLHDIGEALLGKIP